MAENATKSSLLANKHFHSILGLLVSVGLIVWILLSVDLSEVGGELKKFRFWAILPAFAGLMAHFSLRALRWRYLLPERVRPPEFVKLLDAIMLGNFATYILPLRAGEFVRPYVLSRQSDYSFSSGFVSVVIERFFDLACVLLSFGIIIFYIDGIPSWVVKGAIMLSILALAIFAFILLGSLSPQLILGICRWILSFLPQKISEPIFKFLTDFIGGASVLAHHGNLLIVLVLSILVWLSSYGLGYLYFFFFDMETSVALAVTGGVIVALAVAAPSAPGFLGVYQTACIAAFDLFHRSPAQGLAYSIVSHLFQYIVFILYAWFFFSRSKLSFRSIIKSREVSGEIA